MITIKEALQQLRSISEAVSDSGEELEAKIRKVFKDNRKEDSRIDIFETNEHNDAFVEHFDDHDVDFNNLIYNPEANSENCNPVFSFMISGGNNGNGHWEEYLSELENTFKELQKETGLEPLLYKMHTDILDDLWTGYVFMYDHTPEEMKESYKKLYEELIEEPIEEKVEKHDTLNPKLFDGTQLRPEIKEAVKKIAEKYMKTLEEYEVPFNLKDIILVGSNTSYNYNDKSDLDLHLLADMSGIKDPKSQATIYGAYASLFNKNYSITFYDIPVEIYVETEDNPVKINGIYSVLQDRWIREPVQQEIPDLDEEAFNKMLDEWKSKCEQVLGITSSTEENEGDLIEN